jgi:hypothetical protein
MLLLGTASAISLPARADNVAGAVDKDKKGELVIFSEKEIFGRFISEKTPLDVEALFADENTTLVCPEFKRELGMFKMPVGTLRLNFINDLGTRVKIEDTFKDTPTYKTGGPAGLSQLTIATEDSSGSRKEQLYAHSYARALIHTFVHANGEWRELSEYPNEEDQWGGAADRSFMRSVRQMLIETVLDKCKNAH